MAFSNGYSYRRKLTIDHTKVQNTDQANFPVLISGTYTYLKTTGNGGKISSSSGYDIRFEDTNGTKLDYELEEYTANTGDFIGWVRLATVFTASDTNFYMYYGNSSVTTNAEQNVASVWTTGSHTAVYHLGNGTTLSAADATGSNNGTINGSVAAGTGKIYGGVAPDGTSTKYISTSYTLPTNNFTMSGWVKTTTTGRYTFGSGNTSTGTAGSSFQLNSGTVIVVMRRGSNEGSGDFTATTTNNTDGNWHFYHLTMSSTSGEILYYDGSSAGSLPAKTTSLSQLAMTICRVTTDSTATSGTIDEVKVASVARSADWVKTEYNNQNSPSTFYSVANEELALSVSDSTTVTDSKTVTAFTPYSYYSTITIDHTKVGSNDSTNFPVLISGTYNFLKTTGNGGRVQNASGYDVGFYADSGFTQRLNWETESYNASTGQVIYWVQVPTVSHTTDTVIYLAYGDSGITSDLSNKVGTWDTNYQGVFHLSTVTGGASSVLDSTANNHHGSPTGSPTNVTGQIGGGGHFVSASTQYVSIPISNYAQTYGTVSWWGYTTDVYNDSGDHVFFFAGTSSGWLAFQKYVNNLVYVGFTDSGGTHDNRFTVTASNANFVQNAWAYYVVQWTNSGTTTAYVNNNLIGTYSGSTTAFNLGGSTLLSYNTSTDGINGNIDEFRVAMGSNAAARRSTDWITAEYNNQLKPDKADYGTTGFYTVSNITSVADSTTVTDTPNIALALQISVSDSTTVTDSPAVTQIIPWAFFRTITVDHTKAGSNDSTNFPVLVSDTYAFLADTSHGGNVQSSSGYDIGFYADSALTQKLNWETELYTNTSGKVAYWVQLPTLSHSSDTSGNNTFYIAYGAAGITTDQSNPRPGGSGWLGDTNFKGVWHLAATTAGGSTLNANDSTSNANNGTLANTPTDVAGQIGGAAHFVHANTQHVTISGDPASLKITGNMTVSFWAKFASTADSPAWGLINKNDDSSGRNFGTWVLVSNGGLAQIWQSAGGQFYGLNHTAPSNAMHHWVYTFQPNGKIAHGYLDGVADTGFTVWIDNWGSSTALVDTTNLWTFGDKSNGSWPASADIDEIRISNSIRGADWVLAEYNNQVAPDKGTFGASGFYTLGAQANLLTSQDSTTVTDTANVVIVLALQISVSDTTVITDSSASATATGAVAYWKFDESSGTSATDATGRGHTGTLSGGTIPTWASGKINNGLNVHGTVAGTTSSYLSVPTSADWTFGSSDFSIGYWVNATNSSGYYTTIDTGYASNTGILVEYDVVNAIWRIYMGTTVVYIRPFTMTAGAWYYMVVRRTGTNLDIVINSSTLGVVTNSTSITNSGNSIFLGKYSGGEAIEGFLDEFGIWSRALSDSEVASLYNSGTGLQYPYGATNPNVMIVSNISVSDSTTVTDTPVVERLLGFAYVRSVTVDHTKAGSNDATNFPVLISGTYSFLATTGNGGLVQNANGYDISFYADAALTQKLNWETEYYNASNGKVVYWVQLPALSHTSDTLGNNTFYLAYGDASVKADKSNPTPGGSGWLGDTNYAGVWHLPNGTTLTANDSTANANNGTLSVSQPTAVSGQVDGGAAFASASSQYISMADASSLKPTGAWTISGWFKLASTTAVTTIFSSYSQNTSYAGIAVGVNVDGTTPHKIGVLQGNNTGTGSGNFGEFHGTTTVDDNTWRYVVMSSDGTSHSVSVYVNGGSNEGSLAFGTALAPAYSTNFPRIGVTETASGTRQGYWPGSLDEIRLSNIVRTTDWITAEYNNQLKPDKADFGATGFYTINGQANLLAATDLATVTDSPNVKIDTSLSISVSDSTTVTDAPVIATGNLTIAVSDASTVTETITLLDQDSIVISDSATVSDVPLLAVSDMTVSVADGVSVTESDVLLDQDGIVVSDGAGVSDVPTVASGDMTISVSDNTTVTESDVLLDQDGVVVSDGAGVSDVATLRTDDLAITVADSTTVTESDVLLDQDGIVASDGAGVSDVPTVASGDMTISVSDNTTVTESDVLLDQDGIVVSDGAGVGDVPMLSTDSLTIQAADNTTVSESTALLDQGGLTVSDSATVSDVPLLAMSDMTISVSDNTTVTESDILLDQDGVVVSDGAGVGDVPMLRTDDLAVAVTDSTTVTESDVLLDQEGLVVSDGAGVSDVPVLAISDMAVSISDGTTVTETATLLDQDGLAISDGAGVSDVPTLRTDNLAVVATDMVAASDSPSLLVLSAGQIAVLASDGTAVTDVPSVASSDMAISVSDNTTVTESDILLDQEGIVVSDGAGVSDVPTLRTGDLSVVTTDTTTVTESTALLDQDSLVFSDGAGVSDVATLRTDDLAVVTTDSTTVTESDVLLDQEGLVVNDGAGVTDVPLLAVSDLAVATTDAVTVSDGGLVTIQSATDLDISASDVTTVTESITLNGSEAGLVSDGVSLTESWQVTITSATDISAGTSDDTTVLDTATVSAAPASGLSVSASELVTSNDDVNVVIGLVNALSVVTSDTANLTDTAQVSIGSLAVLMITASDIVTADDALVILKVFAAYGLWDFFD